MSSNNSDESLNDKEINEGATITKETDTHNKNCDIKDDDSCYNIDEEYLKEVQLTLSDTEIKELLQKAVNKKDNGNVLFKSMSYEEASLQYTDGLQLCPLSCTKERAILYANRAAARANISNDAIKGAIKDCDKAIEYDPTYVKAILRRASYHIKLDQLESALEDYQKVLKLNPNNSEAMKGQAVLPSKINEKNEKLKAEMMGKLKDFGNMVLKPFGMSTANFEMKQGPTGGYNINFKQNPN